MNYDTLLQLIEKRKSIVIADVTQVIDDLFLESDDNLQFDNIERVNVLIDIIVKSYKFNSTGDDFHNLVVTIAKQNMYDCACDIIEKGLSLHINNTDLLADFLAYSVKCDRWDQAAKHFVTLASINVLSWTWRAFNFSIDYLCELLYRESADDTQREQINKKIDSILINFIEYYGDKENPYFAEYMIIDMRKGQKVAVETLEKRLEEKPKMKATKCTAKIAEYYFENGDYYKASSYLDMCKLALTSVQPTVREGYIYMLSALCGMCLIYEKGIDNYNEDELNLVVGAVHKDCEAASIAYTYQKFSNYSNLKIQLEIFVKLTGIEYFGEYL